MTVYMGPRLLDYALCAATIKRICIRDNSPPDECPVSASLERNIFLEWTNEVIGAPEKAELPCIKNLLTPSFQRIVSISTTA